jgi:hypothetical protein
MKHSSTSSSASRSSEDWSGVSSRFTPGTNERGEYVQHLHLFNLVERDAPDLVTVGSHYSYPWPLDTVVNPTVEYLDAIYKLRGFEVWPAAWGHFWAEYELTRANDPAATALHGPYLMLYRGIGVHLVCQHVVDIKREARNSLVGHATNEFVRGYVCRKLRRYLALPSLEVTRCESLT